MGTVAVRAATEADVDAIAAIAEASWEHDYPGIVSRDTIRGGVEEWYGPAALVRMIDGDDHLLVVESDGEPVGFSHATVTDGTGSILRLYVHPDHRGAGHGAALLDATIEGVAARPGVERVRAMALSANDAGDEFYRSMGFEPVDTARTRIRGEFHEETVYACRVPDATDA